MASEELSTKMTVAAVQTAPVFLNVAATVDKAVSLIAEAAARGARLVAFPEVFVAAYPYWSWLNSPLDTIELFKRLYKSSITVPGPETERLCEAAREHGMVVVIGVNEIDPVRTGTIYNTNLIIDRDGALLGKHRKLVPTYAEKLTWGNGDGSGLCVHPTACGRLGTLICGENTNTLARFALLAQGEQIHVANCPAFPFSDWYEETEAIRIRAQAHALEGKVFVLVATSLIDSAAIDMLCDTPTKRARMSGKNFALSGVFGPDGRAIGEPLIDEEGIVYAEVDLDDLIAPKLMHDITGHYNQFGVLSLRLNRAAQLPLVETSSDDDADEPSPDFERRAAH